MEKGQLTDFSLKEYASVTTEEFDKALLELMEEIGHKGVLTERGIYEALSEVWNNEALDRALSNRKAAQ